MNALLLYDSYFGNTQKIAKTIAQVLDAKTIAISDFTPDMLDKLDLLIVGSPIRGWRPSENISNFLSSLKRGQLKGIKATAFDTRVKLFIHGDAAGQVTRSLKKAGADIISKPTGFIVKGLEGPLLPGELEKARKWSKDLQISLDKNGKMSK